MLLLNMAFTRISSSGVENIYTSCVATEIYIFFTSRVQLKPYSTKSYEFFFNHFGKEVHLIFFKISLFCLSLDTEHGRMLRGNQVKCS